MVKSCSSYAAYVEKNRAKRGTEEMCTQCKMHTFVHLSLFCLIVQHRWRNGSLKSMVPTALIGLEVTHKAEVSVMLETRRPPAALGDAVAKR